MAQDNIVHQKHTRYPFQATGILTIFAEENQTILFMCKTKYLITALAIAMTGYCRADVPPTLDLSGQWQVSLDSMETFQPIRLPGTTDIAGLGVKNTLQPELAKPQVLHLTRKHSFVGAAWYRRTFSVGKEMAGRPLTLLLERIIWQSQVWIDGVKLPKEEESLSTPHEYFIPEGLAAGEHEMLIRIDNRKRYDISTGELGHAYTNETQVKWNGILGRMELKAEGAVAIHRVSTYPDISAKSLRVNIVLVKTGKKARRAKVTLQAACGADGKKLAPITFTVKMDKDTVAVDRTYAMGEDVRLWDEFSPVTYTLDVSCQAGKDTDTERTTFGMREVDSSKGYLAVNGNRVFLRGALESCIFPLTGNPPTDEAGWEKVFTSAKAWGLNHLRFHSYCPPEAAFAVADRMGMYLQVELPNWSLTVGKDEGMNRFLYDEFNRISAAYGNHPSFCLLTAGNELQPDFDFLNKFVSYMKRHDNRHLYATTTFTFEKGHGGHPEPEDQFFVTQWTDKGWVRGQGVFDAEQPNFNKDYKAACEGVNVPLISHEIGQYSVYPDISEISKYTGTLDPLNFKAIKRDLENKVLIDKAGMYTKASGEFAVQLYKEEIERAMKTPQFNGYQLLGLQDYSGQGTALVGLVDAFWDSKGLTSESYFRQFCAPVVPLARFGKATWTADETFVADIEIANYYKDDISNRKVTWTLTDTGGNRIAGGNLQAATLAKGTVTPVGKIQAALGGVSKASKLKLEVAIDGTGWKNNWSVWVYPEISEMPAGDVIVTADIDKALSSLRSGKKVLYSPEPDKLDGLEGKFLPVFWSPVHFPKQAGTMGLLCYPEHPAMAYFPTDTHSDWQWWNLVKRSRVLVVDSLPGVTPIVEVVDNFANNRRLVSVFEANCGKGKLVMSSIDLLSPESRKPETRQLLYSLLKYMNTARFAPGASVTEQDLRSLLSKDGEAAKKTNAVSIYE